MTNAPYHSELCNGPEGGYALWRNASDGVRLRIGLWPNEGAKATVLIFTGRTEYIEKYAHLALDFNNAGYAVATLDWRGQGLSDRLLKNNPYRGHVGSFADYQKDVATLLETLKEENLPAPIAMIAHSMGGCIGLRSLLDGLPVKGAVFSAPMWRISMSPALRPIAWGLSNLSQIFGFESMLAPGTNPRGFILSDPFEDNTLTRDRAMWELMSTQAKTVPELELGGPSIGWVGKAGKECAAIMKAPAPSVPVLTFLGDNERIVDASAIHQKMSDWDAEALNILPEAEHEVFMERPETRQGATEKMLAFVKTL